MTAADWVNSIPGVKPSDQFIALDRRLFEDCVARALSTLSADAIRQGEGELRDALQALENACDDLAANRSGETYRNMIDCDRATPYLHALSDARRNARALLRRYPATPASHASDGGEGMRPFFSYYGAKWTGAKHYGPPRHDLVIEPFAGSASYATRWDCRNAKLYDVSQDICDLWAWLIGCSVAEVMAIPDAFENYAEVQDLPRGAQLLVRFWVSKGRAEPSGTLSPWYFQWRSSSDCRVWGAAVKRRVAEQKPLIEHWQIERKAWWEIDVEAAHWHIDPPYNNDAGRRYPNSTLSYSSLAAWCRGLPGEVDVCENVGADWLPFDPLYEVVTSRGRRSGAVSKEAVWRKEA